MDRKQLVIDATRLALRPLVRLWLASGVMYQDAARTLKRLYVDVASEDYGLRGRPTNAARVALLTGLDRKEVSRLRAERAAPAARRPAPDRLSRVLSAWHQDGEFVDAATGEPRALPLHGPHPSFDSLVERYGGDVPATTIAKELERGGAVAAAADGRLVARTRYFMVKPFDETAVLRSGEVLADLGNTVHHNVVRAPEIPSLFEGRASNRRIAPAALAAFGEFLECEAEALLERVDAWLTEHESPDDPAAVRLGVGIYAIRAPAASEAMFDETQSNEHEAS